MNFLSLILVVFASSELLFVIEIAKEGTRSPLKIPTWAKPEEPGVLTSDGFAEQYELGKMIEERYHSLIHPYYSEDDISARSSAQPSCQDSLKAQLEGIYERPNDDYKINITRESEDFLFRPQIACPRISWLGDFRMQHNVFQDILARALSHQEAFKELTGEEVDQ